MSSEPLPSRLAAPAALAISLDEVQAVIGAHVPLYRRRAPQYQATLIQSFAEMWDPSHPRLLDVGGGTGIMAHAMKRLLGLDHVTSVDVHARFLPGLDIETAVFDGARLPFTHASFDCVTLSNVLHHVPGDARGSLLGECRRVAGQGPIYIKDHVAQSRLDHARLLALDAMGNVPFGGMVRASYLSAADWQRLARESGHRIARQISGPYRAGAFGLAFPNRLEVTMLWLPAR